MNLLKELKEQVQDFEWYPTTKEIINIVISNIDKNYLSILDIGAGDGRVLEAIGKAKKSNELYAIEKADTHIKGLINKGIMVIGTDFMQDTLIDKKVDIIFCNPPYSEYVEWVLKILKEAKATVFLVIPKRWANNIKIQKALKDRRAEFEVIYSGDFLNADRQERVKVDIVKINLNREIEGATPKDLFFKEFIFNDAVNKDKSKNTDNTLVKADTIEALVSLYNNELYTLIKNFKEIGSLDYELLKTMGIDRIALQQSFYSKIDGLKSKYWNEVFKRADSVKRYLTYRNIQNIFSTINRNNNIDFTVSNIHSMLLYFIKQANLYKDKQIVEYVEDRLYSRDVIIAYKSNKKAFYKGNKWDKIKNNTHYYLTNKFVINGWNSEISFSGDFRITESGLNLLEDTKTILYTLGYSVITEIEATRKETLFYLNRNHIANPLKKGEKTNLGLVKEVQYLEDIKEYIYKIGEQWYNQKFVHSDRDVAFRVKFYKNGNCHINFKKEIMDTLNIVFARLKGWIKTPQEASDEMGIDLDISKNAFLLGMKKLDIKLIGV